MGLGEGCGGRPRARAKKDRKYIPAMPMPLAVICCILNFLVPGMGTIIAGFSVCCCARTEDMNCCEQFCSSFLSILFGILQLALAPLLLVGWVWSCFWGVSFIGMSKEYYHDNKPFDDDANHTVVTNQPAQNMHNPGLWPSPSGQPAHAYPSGTAYPGPSHGWPPGGQYSGQSNLTQGLSQGQYNPVVPTAPPEERVYPQHPPGYNELPPPYDVDDPYPRK